MFYEDIFTVISTGNSREAPAKSMSMQVKGQPVNATSWTVLLEGSLDGMFFTILMQHKLADGDGKIVDLVPPTLVRFTRIRVSALSLGAATGIKVSVFVATT